MKFVTEKKIWQKISIILVFIILFEFIFSSHVRADEKEDNVLLDPVVSLFVSIGDGAMALIQEILLQNTGGESLIKIDDGNAGFWSKIIVAGVFILGTAAAVISAIPTGGASVIGWVAFAGGVALTLTVSGSVYAISHSLLEKIYSDMFGKTYYLPMYEVSPYEIFANKVLLFDVNFFDPKPDKVENVFETKFKWETINLSGYGTAEKRDADQSATVDKKNGDTGYVMTADKYKKVLNKYGFNSKDSQTVDATDYGFGNGANTNVWENNNVKYMCFRYTEGNKERVYLWKGSQEEEKVGEKREQSTAYQLQSTVASWYLALRNIALVALLSVLVYIGIRIMLSSIASDKAKYKQMLIDWTVAICLVFLMHYIMSFSVIIVNKITEAISSVTMTSSHTDELKKKLGNAKEYKEAVDLFEFVSTKSDGGEDAGRVKNAWQVLVVDEKDEVSISENEYTNYFFTDEKLGSHPSKEDGSDAKVFVWPANNYMEQARMKLQILRGKGSSDYKYESYGYAIIFVVLIIYTVIFAFTYLKRVIYMAFLTIIAPLVAITYPIDKISDGKSQAFNMWLKEYIFNLLIQPLHLMLYLILIGSAMEFAAKNIFYVILALGFFTPAEKLLRRFFGFEKAQTPGMFGGPAGSALMFGGLQHIMQPRQVKDGLGSGGSVDGDDNKEDAGKISTYDDKLIDFNEPLSSVYEKTSIPKLDMEEKSKPQLNFKDKLNDEQISKLDELEKTGKGPGSKEYNDLLKSFGIDIEGENIQNNTSINIPNNPNVIKMANNLKDKTNNQADKMRKKSIIRGFKQGARTYGTGMKNKLQERYKAKGSLARRGLRVAGGLAGAATLAAAGGIVGITSGDLTKGMQYMAAGAAGGYKVGTAGVDKARNSVRVEGTIKNAKQAYYGDEYEKKQQEEYKKKIVKDEKFLRKLEDKFKIERKEAKQKAKELSEYTDKKGIQSTDDLVKIGLLMKEGKYSKDDILTAVGYNNLALDGKNTNKMSSEEYQKHKQRYKDRLINNNVNENIADESAVRIFDIMDRANKL